MPKYKIAHIINPVKVNSSSDLYIAQPLTFESLRNAKDYAKKNITVELYSCQYEEDLDIIPDYFIKTNNLTRSTADLNLFRVTKKLPFIRDLLDSVIQLTDADFIVYSNVDIGVMPFFYLTILNYFTAGYDFLMINRRTVSNNYKSINDLNYIYSDIGKSHEGIDCFVFRRKYYEKFNFEKSIIGSGPVGLCFAVNFLSNSSKVIWLEESHLTFHIGDDKSWRNARLLDYRIYNFTELKKITYYFRHNINNGKLLNVLNCILDFSDHCIVKFKHGGKIKFTNPKDLIREYLNS